MKNSICVIEFVIAKVSFHLKEQSLCFNFSLILNIDIL